MKAVILAAGKGLRMGLLTHNEPKPLLRLNGRPILEYHLGILHGLADEVVIIIGYLGQQIREYFGTRYRGMKLTYITQDKQLGTGHALLQAKEYLENEDKFLVLMGDDIYSREDVVRLLAEELAVLASESDTPEKFGVLEVKDGHLQKIIEKSDNPPSNLVNTAAYIFTPDIFKKLESIQYSARGELELTDAVASLASEKEVKCIKAEGLWMPIGSPEALQKATELLNSKEVHST